MLGRFFAVVAVLGFAACGGGGNASSSGGGGTTNVAPALDDRTAAVQAWANANPVTTNVLAGRSCGLDDSSPRQNYRNYLRVPGVKVGPSPKAGYSTCYMITWPASAGVVPTTGDARLTWRGSVATIGTYKITAVGADQTGPNGGVYAPIDATFVPTSLGKSIIAAGIAQPQPPITNFHVTISKGATGALVAAPAQ